MTIKDETDLSPYIAYDEYRSLINEVINNPYNHYLNKKIIPYLKARDVLLVKCMWELGETISSILNIEAKDIDFINKLVIL